MACLDTTSKSLTIELTGSPTTQVQWTVHYATRSGTDFTESSNDGVTNSTTPVTMIAAPSSGETISIRDITVYNADVSSVTIVIKLVNGGNSRVLYRQALDTLESWSSLAQKGKDGAQGLTGSVSAASGLILDESSAPNTATNQGALYVPVADNLLRYRGESNGTERRIALIDTTNLATNDLFYYGSDGLFKPIGIGTLDQVLLAKPSSNPPYQWATPVYREVLTANRTYYVRTDGSDSNNGLTGTSGGAFLTIQKARDTIRQIDCNSKEVTIKIGTGTYNISFPGVEFSGFVGLSKLIIEGDTTTPSNVVIQGSGTTNFVNSGLIIAKGDLTAEVKGITLTNTVAGGQLINSRYGAILQLGNNRYGDFANSGIYTIGGFIQFLTAFTIVGGGGSQFVGGERGNITMNFLPNGTVITITGTPTMSRFLYLGNQSSFSIVSTNVTFSGGINGQKYYLVGCSVYDKYNLTDILPGSGGTALTGSVVN